jgi:hypothetical protein
MFIRRGKTQPHSASLAVEPLEDRCLLSVALLPGHLNIKTVKPTSHAVMTVQILSDTTAGANLLKAPQSDLAVSVLDAQGHATALGQPLSVRSQDVNGDGVADLRLTFSRSTLKGLSAGAYTLQVADGTAADTETSTFTLFSPGSKGHQAHQPPAHPGGPPASTPNNAFGLQTAASHNASSQAGQHSPEFQAAAGMGSAAGSPTLPAAAADGLATAASHNGSSQAANHSPVFHKG